MKTIETLSINDPVFYAVTDSIEYFKGTISVITPEYVLFHYSRQYKDSRGELRDNGETLLAIVNLRGYAPRAVHQSRRGDYGGYSPYDSQKRGYIFYNESEARRYCKAHLMKEMYKRINEAKKAMDRLTDFRKDYYPLLSNAYTERVITDLEMVEL